MSKYSVTCVRLSKCIWCEVRIGNKQCLICSVYIPPRNKEDLIKLHNKLNCFKSNQPLIIGGDFNARNELWDSQLLPSRDSAWQMGDNLIEMIFEHNLMIHNNGTPTFYRKSYVSALDVTLSRNLPFKINWSTDINSIQWQHEVKLLSLAAFCEKRCGIILCGSKMPSFSHMYTRYQLMY